MADKAESLVTFIQERCLWQFVSRAPTERKTSMGFSLSWASFSPGGAQAPDSDGPIALCQCQSSRYEIKSEFPG